MNLLTDKIKMWAKERNLQTADPTKQMVKLMEEVGELAEGMVKGDDDLIIDSIGDIFVVLTVLSLQLGIDIRVCVNEAYQEIMHRKGEIVNGVFIKEEDRKC